MADRTITRGRSWSKGLYLGPWLAAALLPSRLASAQPTHPLDNRVSVRLTKVSLGSFLEEIGQQAKLHFNILPGFEQCFVTALMRNVTSREALQAVLTVQGLTYQQLGRSDTYTIVPRTNKPLCPRAKPTPQAAGTCKATKGEPISLKCRKGSLLAFVEIVFEQSSANFFFPDGAEDFPLTARFKGAALDSAMKEIEDTAKVTRLATSGTFVISAKQR